MPNQKAKVQRCQGVVPQRRALTCAVCPMPGEISPCPTPPPSIALENPGIPSTTNVLRFILKRWNRSMMSALPSSMAFSALMLRQVI